MSEFIIILPLDRSEPDAAQIRAVGLAFTKENSLRWGRAMLSALENKVSTRYIEAEPVYRLDLKHISKLLDFDSREEAELWCWRDTGSIVKGPKLKEFLREAENMKNKMLLAQRRSSVNIKFGKEGKSIVIPINVFLVCALYWSEGEEVQPFLDWVKRKDPEFFLSMISEGLALTDEHEIKRDFSSHVSREEIGEFLNSPDEVIRRKAFEALRRFPEFRREKSQGRL